MARKNAFGALGRLSPSYYVQDGVVPRSKLPLTLRGVAEIAARYGFRVAMATSIPSFFSTPVTANSSTAWWQPPTR
jgi:FAD/FMN-containing dehydrogenase